MAQTTMLLVAAADRAKHDRYRDPAVAAREIPNAQSAHLFGAYPFVHTFDPALAAAWLAKALSYTPERYDAASPAEQYRIVGDLWTAFGRFFRAANVQVYGWAPARRAFEDALGFRPPVGSYDYFRGRPRCDWDDQDKSPGMLGGAWRAEAARIYNALPGSDRDMGRYITPYEVIFGRKEDFVDEDNQGCNLGGSGRFACHAPTGEMHRYWLQGDGVLRGGSPNGYSAASGGQIGWVQRAAWNPWSGQHRVFFIPPLRWYYDLLRPLVERAQTYSVSEFVREVKRDVALANDARSREFTVTEESLPAAATREYLAAQREQASLPSIVDASGRAVAGIAAAINPLAGLVGGAVSLVASLAVRAAQSDAPRWIDVFGRFTPAFDYFAISDTIGGATAMFELLPWPEGIPEPGTHGIDAKVEETEDEKLKRVAREERARKNADRPPNTPPVTPPNGPPAQGSGGTLLTLGLLGGAGYLGWKNRAALKRAFGGR